LRRSRLSFAAALAVTASAVLVGVPAVADAAPKPKPDVPVQLITMNDFHGRIQETTGGDSILFTGQGDGPDRLPGNADDGTVIVGGSAHVAATVKQLQASFRAANGDKAGSWFVGAGDLISASPFESSVFKDEPTIEVLDAMGLDASSVGNHEFDRGTEELRRISAATDDTFSDDVTACQGITPGVNGCFGEGEHAFDGADFPYLAANVVSKETGEPMLPPYQVFNAEGGKKIALIGVVTDTTPTIVTPSGVEDVNFIDEAEAVNKYVPELRRRGVEAIGVLVHEGGDQTGPTKANANGCDTLTGPIVDINNAVSDEVDLIVSAHTHAAYNCRLKVPGGHDRLVTSAGYYGRLVSDIRLTLDGRTGDVNRAATYAATNVPVTRTATDANVQSIVDYWVGRSAAANNRVVGFANEAIPGGGTPNRPIENPMNNLVAQSQLEALSQAQFGNPVIAFINPGGVRANFNAGDITYGEVFLVEPFGNTVNAITVTGADIKLALEQQFMLDQTRKTQLIMGTSEGFTYSYDLSQPFGSRVIAESVKLNGTMIQPGQSYRVVANSFLAGGGDSFTAFKNGTGMTTGPVDVDTLESYVVKHTPLSAPVANHSTKLG
jgi:5'-nucleotidase